MRAGVASWALWALLTDGLLGGLDASYNANNLSAAAVRRTFPGCSTTKPPAVLPPVKSEPQDTPCDFAHVAPAQHLALAVGETAVLLAFYWHPLSIQVETLANGRGGCSRMTE